MDSSAVIALPVLVPLDAAPAEDAASTALAEIDAAIALVSGGAARRVRLVAIPFVESVAGVALARATAAGLEFGFERTGPAGVATVTIGPEMPGDG
jgi:hypothetical protein